MSIPNLVIKALAGTGKTFIITSGIKRWRSQPISRAVSNEQQTILNAITTGESPFSILMAAFTVSAKEELDHRLGTIPNCSIRTTYGMGLRAIKQYMGIKGETVTVNKNKTLKLIETIHNGMPIYRIYKLWPGYVPSVRKLVELAKYHAMVSPSDEVLTRLAGNHDVNLGNDCLQIFDTTRGVLELAKENMNSVDFSDMPWLPVVCNLPLEQYDMVMVDEGQDLNHCQQQLILRSGGRVVMVGDKHQAIYGFTGADTESMHTMENHLARSGGVETLPLTISWRCSQAVALAARKIVPEFRAHKNNPQGAINYTQSYLPAQPGDMILCRTNTPLVSCAFQLLKKKIPCYIAGQDILHNMANLIKMLKPASINNLLVKLAKHKDSEEQRLRSQKHCSQASLIALEDKCKCLQVFCNEVDTVDEVFTLMNNIFSTDWSDSIRLSSIHRAKGLEANNVYIIRPDLLPHPLADSLWQLEQESNLKYVAVTRARHTLTFVEGE